MNGFNSTSTILSVGLLVMLLGIGGFDIYAVASERYRTVSDTMSEWAKTFPILPLAVGLVIAHVFWR